MSGLPRRDLLKGAIGIGALALPAGVGIARGQGVRMVVYDSRIAESRLFARPLAGRTKLDVAAGHGSRWAALRNASHGPGRIEGLTAWSDWVAVRGEFERRGLRVVHEHVVASQQVRRSNLVRWTMVPRSA